MKSNWVLKLINLALFVFGAAFVVLHVEFNEGNFLYYFFKTQVYYSVFNKIIFNINDQLYKCFHYNILFSYNIYFDIYSLY